MNQALSFGLLGAGGILLTKALTGSSFADVVKGHPGSVPDTGASLATVAGVGTAAAAAATTAVGGAAASVGSFTGKGLNASQQTFAAELAARTGLNPGVIAAWVLAEEGGQSVAPNGPANWLNIGATDSGFMGGSNSFWANPVSAADATAQWLQGTLDVPGFGSASAGIRAFAATAGQSAATQIAALQHSGWASSGYPDLPGLYQQVTA